MLAFYGMYNLYVRTSSSMTGLLLLAGCHLGKLAILIDNIFVLHIRPPAFIGLGCVVYFTKALLPKPTHHDKSHQFQRRKRCRIPEARGSFHMQVCIPLV